MDISKEISMDIVKYLQIKKGQSVDEIATNMSTTPSHIQKVINKEEAFKSEDINSYLKNQKIRFWEFAIEAIPENHLPPSTKKKIRICKELSDHLKKAKKKS